MSLGDAEIDRQHRQIFELGNRILAATAYDEALKIDLVHLYAHTRTHFQAEEARMRERRDPRRLRIGDVVSLEPMGRDENGVLRYSLDQDPQIEGALVAVEPETGLVKALVGGVDHHRAVEAGVDAVVAGLLVTVVEVHRERWDVRERDRRDLAVLALGAELWSAAQSNAATDPERALELGWDAAACFAAGLRFGFVVAFGSAFTDYSPPASFAAVPLAAVPAARATGTTARRAPRRPQATRRRPSRASRSSAPRSSARRSPRASMPWCST